MTWGLVHANEDIQTCEIISSPTLHVAATLSNVQTVIYITKKLV